MSENWTKSGAQLLSPQIFQKTCNDWHEILTTYIEGQLISGIWSSDGTLILRQLNGFLGESAQLKWLGAYSERQRNGNLAVLDPQQKKGPAKHSERANGEVYLSATSVELYPFDERYIELLRRGDRATQEHFVRYFGQLLRIKLRSRKLPSHVIQDVQQETFFRVLRAIRTGNLLHPERLGPYVNSVCKNILQEQYRLEKREQYVELEEADGPDAAADLEATMIATERSESVYRTLRELDETDAAVLRSLLSGRDKDEVCRELNVTREYLRVLMHRAIGAFKTRYQKKKGAHGTGPTAG